MQEERNKLTLDGNDIRPTTDRVKEGIFSSIQFDLEGASVLDLFAGSGQLGIEALSRGADRAYFVDNSKKSLETVKKNLAITGLENKSKLFNMNGHDFLKITDQKFDFIFLDPPYDMGILTEILPDLCDKLKSGGKIFFSSFFSPFLFSPCTGELARPAVFRGSVHPFLPYNYHIT